MTTWIPASCTLPTTEQPLRVAEFDALFAERLTGRRGRSRCGCSVVLTGGPGMEDSVR
ncbi:hypothetical protein AB0D78_47270 [Streptomyces avermitilis]|uniref:hypothetical protein n=1 Tax=Streptomyces avermitilis TaxID=33903 RepID=UPI0033DBA1B8